MNVDRLRAVQSEEREADSLRPLPDGFYREVAEYIGGLREQRAAAAAGADDPFGADDVRRLTDEIETAEEVAEAIYERRVGKLVKQASLAAAGMSVEEEGLTSEEAELFADIVAQIEAHRDEVFATFGASGPRRSPDGPPSVGTSDDDSTSEESSADPPTDGASPTDDPPADPGEGPATPDPPADDEEPELASEDADERITLRITRDVGEVFGVDERTYELAAEDVVSLPTANAKPLIDRDAAEPIE